MSEDHWLGDQSALEAMVRFGDEEIKHQELFRRIERMSSPATSSKVGRSPRMRVAPTSATVGTNNTPSEAIAAGNRSSAPNHSTCEMHCDKML